ncbi:MAG: hypothetical protein WEB53_06085 [Akkermansiaceae bacterium]
MIKRLKTMPIADLSLVLSTALLAFAIPCILLLALSKDHMSFGQASALVLVVWLSPLIVAIAKSGPRRDEENRMLDLGVFHWLQILIVVCALPHMGGNPGHLAYLMGFVEFIILGALVIYGLICLRILAMPPWKYFFYLGLNSTAIYLTLSRI